MSRFMDFACGALAAVVVVLVVLGLRWAVQNPLVIAQGAVVTLGVIVFFVWAVMPHGGDPPLRR